PDVKLTGDGGPPLAKAASFVETKCPTCNGPARREVETMDTFVDSTWYFARFLDPKNAKEPFARANADAWLPVDIYIGGPEHAVLHLMYFRFWTMVMKDIGLVAHGEPAKKLLTQGMVVAPTFKCPVHGYVERTATDAGDRSDLSEVRHRAPCGELVAVEMEKMGKSKANGVSPDQMATEYGADTARIFSLFAAPPEKDLEWDEKSVIGSYRFLKRVWNFTHAERERIMNSADGLSLDGAALEKESALGAAAWRSAHDAVRTVTADVGERYHYNTGVSTLMALINELEAIPVGDRGKPLVASAMKFAVETLLRLLNPYAPHITEELWEQLGHTSTIVAAGWPKFDPAALVTSTAEFTVQVNGKVRGHVTVAADADEKTVLAAAEADEKVKPWIDGKERVKNVFIPKSRMLNLVVKG
ncbi:MAG TPA: class I tRNA ligase family protein, partial [bacterium]|nr:class I tRNA ligase family protein [bacterium]